MSSTERALIIKGLRLIKQERYAMLWSTILEYRDATKSKAQRKRKRVRKHINSGLDECFIDHPPFTGNEMRRVQNKLELLGISPTFRSVLNENESSIKRLLQDKQIGPGARRLINDIRDHGSHWSKLLRQEKKETSFP